MTGWREYKLGEITTKIGDGLHGTPMYDDNGDYCFVNGNNLSKGKVLIKPDTKRVNESEFFKYRKPLSDKTILLGINGTYGNLAFYNGEKCILGKSACYINVSDDVDKYFLYYNFLNSDFQLFLDSIATGTTIPNVPLKGLREYSILLPPLPEQRAIASVLSSLDDKIDLLHRQNKTLEAMAETLFRQWFVEEADEGWEEGKLCELCVVITKGTTPTTLGHQFTETGINFIKAESITDTGDFIWEKFAKISDETHNYLSRSIIQEGDILCSIAGTIGRVAISTGDILPANTNQAIAILRSNPEKCFPEFIYLFMKSDLFRETMDGKIVHAVQPNLSLGEIGNTTLRIPPNSYLMDFRNVIQPIFNKKKKNYNQIRTIEKLRDTLLPKLMSGEVRVDYRKEAAGEY